MEPRIHYAKTSDGVNIAYWTLGSGPPIVFLPPLIASHCQQEWQIPEWREFYEDVARVRTIARFDTRGSGLSDRDVPVMSAENLLIDLTAVVDTLGWDRFALFGNNWTGLLAMMYAAREPERVSRLLLWCSHISGGREQSRTLSIPLLETNWDLFANVVALIVFGWEAGALGRSFAEYIKTAITQEQFLELVQSLEQVDAAGLLSDIRAPTLVIQRRDLESPNLDAARRIAASIPNARMALHEGRSAAPFIESPDAIKAAIIEFLSEEEPAPVQQEAAGFRSILFTDLASSTALTQRLGDAKAQDLLRAHNAIVRDALAASGGTEIKHTGDGIMASFPSASAALDCAIAIQRAANATPPRIGEGPGEGSSLHPSPATLHPLAIHIGLNAGEPVAEESDLFGTAVQLARRICDHASSGQILASNVVRELAAGKRFLFADIGEVVPKGFEEPVRLYEVRWRE